MPHSTGLRSCIYFVPDLALARAWYADVFGVEPYFDEPFYVGFRIGGSELGLDPDPLAGSPGAGGAVAYWGVPDVAAALTRIEAEVGTPVLEPLRDVGGGIKLAVVADPFGNTVGLIEGPDPN